MREINLLLIHSPGIFCQGLVKLLESEPNINVARTSSSPREAVEAARTHKPDAVLIDIDSSQPICIEVISHIRQIVPDTCIIVLTNSKASADFFSAIKAGATGYIFKDSDFENLVKAITLVAEGNLVIASPMARNVIGILKFTDERRHQATVEALNLLSEKEKAVLALIVKCAPNKEIASTLFISENTAKVHVRNIMQKLHARNRMEARVCAIEAGLLSGLTETDAK